MRLLPAKPLPPFFLLLLLSLLFAALECTPATMQNPKNRSVERPAQTVEPPAQPILRLETAMHTAVIKQMDIDRAERFLVTGSDDKTVRLWQLPEGRLLRILRLPIDTGNEGKVYAVAISPAMAKRWRRQVGRAGIGTGSVPAISSIAPAAHCRGVSPGWKMSYSIWPFLPMATGWRQLLGEETASASTSEVAMAVQATARAARQTDGSWWEKTRTTVMILTGAASVAMVACLPVVMMVFSASTPALALA